MAFLDCLSHSLLVFFMQFAEPNKVFFKAVKAREVFKYLWSGTFPVKMVRIMTRGESLSVCVRWSAYQWRHATPVKPVDSISEPRRRSPP
jgi:hypothetical protein